MQLQPGETFTIFRQLFDHTDTDTNYVRATIRHARTAELLDTVDLTDNGNGDFTGNWEVHQDASGLGFYVKVTTSVYTDAAYTTKNANYRDEGSTYLVQKRTSNRIGGGGLGEDINYEKIRNIVLDVIQESSKEVQNVDIAPVVSALASIQNQIQDIQIPKIPEQKEVDLSGIKNRLDMIEGLVGAIDVPPPEKVDFQPVIKEIKKADIKKIQKRFDDLFSRVKNFLMDDVGQILKAVNEVKAQIEGVHVVIASKQKKPEKKQEKPRRFRAFDQK